MPRVTDVSTQSPEPLRIVGAEGSPYSCKLRAVMRFRRIPYQWIHQGSPDTRDLPQPRVSLLPQLIMRDADGDWVARTDTSPLIRELETSHAGRSVIPDDPALAFIDMLIEDYADEWLTKAMFHYRWAFPADITNASKLLPSWFRPDQSDEAIEAAGTAFAERQTGRLWVVGSNETTAPVIEGSYQRLLALLDRLFAEHRFLLGARPGAGDFGVYGQLTQLVRVDPTPAALAGRIAPRVVAWTDLCGDLSGREVTNTDWHRVEELPDSLRAILAEAARTYVPVMLANLEALERSAERVECEVDGRAWVQQPFPYQGKCVRWIREAYAALSATDAARVDAVLDPASYQPLLRG